MKKYLVYYDPLIDGQFVDSVTWVTRDNKAFLLQDKGSNDIWHESSLARLGGNERVLLQTDSYDELLEYLQNSRRHDSSALATILAGGI